MFGWRVMALVAGMRLIETPMQNLTIDYHALVAQLSDAEELERFCSKKLPELWCEAYCEMPNEDEIEILQITDGGYHYLFNHGADRVVAAFGVSQFNPADRDSKRMAGFLGKTSSKKTLQTIANEAPSAEVANQRQRMAELSWRDRFFQNYGHLYDRGHFMSHRQGGGLDINLFPQRSDINQGQGSLGAAYRAMETECVNQAQRGTQVFCFSRPIYDDNNWVPARLDYGIIYGRQRISIMTFPNKI